MKVKKFYGNDNYDVVTKIRGELGPNAVILHQKKVKPKGLLGIFKRSVVEAVAAIEDVPSPVRNRNILNMAKAQEQYLRKKVALKSGNKGLEKEINDIKSMLSTVIDQIENANTPKPSNNSGDIKDSYIYNVFLENEVDEDLIPILLEDYNWDTEQLQSGDKKIVKDFLAQIMPSDISNNDMGLDSKVIFFIGPTGVGKTTTIAKLAANYSLEKGLKIGLISADTYRIAAVEQLKVYSDILNIPLEVIYSPDEIHDAINRLNDRDIIMVDTAGRSHKNHEHMQELVFLLDKVKDKGVYLVISSTTKNSDLKNILDRYSFLKDYKIIFTKLDEVDTYGSILNIAMTEPSFLSYITTGQSVPDDIEIITSSKILDMLLGEFQYD
ncbi:MAG: flagellar biosynthesis protein FlhF [Candidatus Alkaliphilus sp. MAG34]|nr:flagellar biosynthesis protein FlhF [Clostridiales bacterium]